MKLNELQTLADLSVADLLSQANNYTPDSFEEVEGMLVAETLWRKGCKDYLQFVVGKIERAGWTAEVKHDGKVIARNERNTGWGFVADEN